jgi:hypothetical protein
MTLIILAGVWALAFGQISLHGSFKMKGNQARIFGLLLIAAASFGLPFVYQALGPYVPSFVTSNDGLKAAYDMLVGAFGVYVTAWFMTKALPALHIPTLTVSLKRRRA